MLLLALELAALLAELLQGSAEPIPDHSTTLAATVEPTLLVPARGSGKLRCSLTEEVAVHPTKV